MKFVSYLAFSQLQRGSWLENVGPLDLPLPSVSRRLPAERLLTSGKEEQKGIATSTRKGEIHRHTCT